MKRLLYLFIIALLCFCHACQKQDRVLAEVYYQKLYAKDVSQRIPRGLSLEDSLAFANRIVEDWIQEQIVLHEAEKVLSVQDKDFSEELDKYRRSLMMERYFEVISADTALYSVSDEEVRRFISEKNSKWEQERNLVKINYVKLSDRSPLIAELRPLLFDEKRRVEEKAQIETLCADSIEYFIDDEQWLLWDDIAQEVGAEDLQQEGLFPKYIEKQRGGNYYLVVVMDYKTDKASAESEQYMESIRQVLMQQKKVAFITKHCAALRQQVEADGDLVR